MYIQTHVPEKVDNTKYSKGSRAGTEPPTFRPPPPKPSCCYWDLQHSTGAYGPHSRSVSTETACMPLTALFVITKPAKTEKTHLNRGLGFLEFIADIDYVSYFTRHTPRAFVRVFLPRKMA